MPKLPRPSLTELIGFRVTKEEREKIEKEAERQGLSVSDFVRKVIKLYLDGEKALPELNIKKILAFQTLSIFELHYTLMSLILPLLPTENSETRERIERIQRRIEKKLRFVEEAKRALEKGGWKEFSRFVKEAT